MKRPSRLPLLLGWVGIAALWAVAVAVSLGATARAEPPGSLPAAIAALDAGNYPTALDTLHRLARADNPSAELWLAHVYDDGIGVAIDHAEAVHWLTEAAENGSIEAARRLGEIYRDGNVVPQDFVRARRWIALAANEGDAAAQRDLGELYAAGKGTKKDAIWAYVWLDLAAARGDRAAQAERRDLAKTMPSASVLEAQTLAARITSSLPQPTDTAA